MHDQPQPAAEAAKHEPLGVHGALPGAPNGPPRPEPCPELCPELVEGPVEGPPFQSASVRQAHHEPVRNPQRFDKLTPPSAMPLMSFFPIRELPRIPCDDAHWIWDGFLARQAVTILMSEPKAGKSTLVFALLQKMLLGEPFLQRATKSCGVIYFSEEPLAALREKAERFELPVHGERIQLVSKRQKPNQHIALTDALALDGALKKAATIDAGLIVIDTLSAWAGMKAEAENSSSACETMMNQFRDAATASNTALLLIHHTRKDGTTARGSTVLSASADILVMLQREDLYRATGAGGNAGRIKVASRFSDAPDPIQFELTDSGYARIGPQPDAVRKHAEVWKCIPAEPPGISREEICFKTGLSLWQVRCAVNELNGTGSLRALGEGINHDPLRYIRFSAAERRPQNAAS